MDDLPSRSLVSDHIDNEEGDVPDKREHASDSDDDREQVDQNGEVGESTSSTDQDASGDDVDYILNAWVPWVTSPFKKHNYSLFGNFSTDDGTLDFYSLYPIMSADRNFDYEKVYPTTFTSKKYVKPYYKNTPDRYKPKDGNAAHVFLSDPKSLLTKFLTHGTNIEYQHTPDIIGDADRYVAMRLDLAFRVACYLQNNEDKNIVEDQDKSGDRDIRQYIMCYKHVSDNLRGEFDWSKTCPEYILFHSGLYTNDNESIYVLTKKLPTMKTGIVDGIQKFHQMCALVTATDLAKRSRQFGENFVAIKKEDLPFNPFTNSAFQQTSNQKVLSSLLGKVEVECAYTSPTYFGSSNKSKKRKVLPKALFDTLSTLQDFDSELYDIAQSIEQDLNDANTSHLLVLCDTMCNASLRKIDIGIVVPFVYSDGSIGAASLIMDVQDTSSGSDNTKYHLVAIHDMKSPWLMAQIDVAYSCASLDLPHYSKLPSWYVDYVVHQRVGSSKVVREIFIKKYHLQNTKNPVMQKISQAFIDILREQRKDKILYSDLQKELEKRNFVLSKNVDIDQICFVLAQMEVCNISMSGKIKTASLYKSGK